MGVICLVWKGGLEEKITRQQFMPFSVSRRHDILIYTKQSSILGIPVNLFLCLSFDSCQPEFQGDVSVKFSLGKGNNFPKL